MKFRHLGSVIAVLILSCGDARANVVGTDFQNFNPTSNGLDFVTVQSSETLETGVINLGLFTNFARNALPDFDTGGQRLPTDSRNSITAMDLNIGYGLWDHWDIGLNVPVTISQSVGQDTERIQFASSGVNEVRLNSKYRLLGDDDGGVAVVGTINQNIIIDNPFAGQDPGLTTTLELAADQRFGVITVGANVGHRWRDPGKPIPEVPVTPLGNQWIASLAMSYFAEPIDSTLIWEIYGSHGAQDQDDVSERLQRSSETLLGMKHLFNHNLALHGGAGTFLDRSTASPDWRVYLGANWVIGPFGEKPEPPVATSLKIEKSEDETIETITLQEIQFAFDSDRKVERGAKKFLDELADYLDKITFVKLIIKGHTDSLGSEEYNQDLSQRRAKRIRDYLSRVRKLPGEKMEFMGLGESEPIADNATYQGRRKNRRVEFEIHREPQPAS